MRNLTASNLCFLRLVTRWLLVLIWASFIVALDGFSNCNNDRSLKVNNQLSAALTLCVFLKCYTLLVPALTESPSPSLLITASEPQSGPSICPSPPRLNQRIRSSSINKCVTAGGLWSLTDPVNLQVFITNSVFIYWIHGICLFWCGNICPQLLQYWWGGSKNVRDRKTRILISSYYYYTLLSNLLRERCTTSYWALTPHVNSEVKINIRD